jgi:hypothetical protein
MIPDALDWYGPDREDGYHTYNTGVSTWEDEEEDD